MKDLTEIASISGKGGLFRVVKPGRMGVILESMDDRKIKVATNPNHKVSILGDISIYTNTDEGSVPLDEVLRKIFKEFGDDPGIDGKSSSEELISFIEYIIPEYDPGRVYPSDVKKLVNWYKILLQEHPEFFEDQQPEKSSKGKDAREDKSEKQSADASAVKKEEDAKKKSGSAGTTSKKSGQGAKPSGKTAGKQDQ